MNVVSKKAETTELYNILTQTDGLQKAHGGQTKNKVNAGKGKVGNAKTLRKSLFPKSWSFDQKFSNKQAALAFMESDWIIQQVQVSKVSKGRIVHFRCNRIKECNPKCGALKCLFYSVNGDEVLLYSNNKKHKNDRVESLLVNREVSNEVLLPVSESVVNLTPYSEYFTELIKNEDISENLKMEIDNDSIEWCLDNIPSKKNFKTEEIASQSNSDTVLKEELIIEEALVEVPFVNKETDKANELPIQSDGSNDNDPHLSLQCSIPTFEAVFFPSIKEPISKTSIGSNTISDKSIKIIVSDDSDNDTLSGDDINKPEEWIFEKTFDDYKAAMEHMEKLNLFSFNPIINNHSAKEFFKCKKATGAIDKCPASRFLQYTYIYSFIYMYSRNVKHVDGCPNTKPQVQIQEPSMNLIDLVDDDDNDIKFDKTNNHQIKNSKNNEIICSSRPQQINNNKTRWILEQAFETIKEAKDYLTELKIWSCKKKTKSNDGFIEIYRCNLIKSKRKECAAAKFIHIQEGKNVFLYKTEEDHTHTTLLDNTTPDQSGVLLDDTIKNKIDELVKSGLAPGQVLDKLLGDLDASTNQALYTFVQKMQQDMQETVLRKSVINCFKNWFPQITEIPNDHDEHKPYCVRFYLDHANEEFRCFLTTRYLLKKMINCNSIQIESSPKLFWQRNLITIIGTTDKDETFYLCGIAVTSSRRQRDYEFIFDALRKGIRECHNKLFNPEYLLADENAFLVNAFSKKFGNKICNCPKITVHQIMNKLGTSVKVNVMREIRGDIAKLFKLSSKFVFEKAVRLFLLKWQPRADLSLVAFLRYFKTVSVVRVLNWFDIFPRFIPDTSVAIRNEYNTLRTSKTFLLNLPIDLFQFYIKFDIENLSRFYSINGPKTLSTPIISPLIQDKANKWRKLLNHFSKVDGIQETHYYIPAGDGHLVCKKKFQKYLKCEHTTLEELFDIQSSFWRVTCPIDRKLSRHGETLTCNCPTFVDDLVCEHSVGMASVLTLI